MKSEKEIKDALKRAGANMGKSREAMEADFSNPEARAVHENAAAVLHALAWVLDDLGIHDDPTKE